MARKSTKTKSTTSKKEEKVTAVAPEAKAAADTEVKETAKAPAKKTTAKKTTTKKATAKKTTAKAEKPATETKKAEVKAKAETKTKTAKKAEVSSTTHFFEIDGEQISTADIEERIREAYKAEGHRIGNMKDVSVYYNFAERRAYYVVNGKPEDKFVEF
ncbi:MAG: DUF6465 family protein [Lachnospiraceae bacterium]|nr:DUF6465 family protein [Lachnospiraceae bacterium]